MIASLGNSQNDSVPETFEFKPVLLDERKKEILNINSKKRN